MNKLLLDEYPLVVLPTLAKHVGINGAIVLQQLHYWLLKSKNIEDGYRWRYRTYEEWSEDLPWLSVAGVRKILNKLEKDGMVISGNYNKSAIDKTKWYRINYNHPFIKGSDVCPKVAVHVIQSSSPCDTECATIPETTTETTTETTKENKLKEKNSLTKDRKVIPPKQEWVQAFITDQGINLDVDRFMNFYGTKGWCTSSKMKMVDWVCAVHTAKAWCIPEEPKEEVYGDGGYYLDFDVAQRLHEVAWVREHPEGMHLLIEADRKRAEKKAAEKKGSQ